MWDLFLFLLFLAPTLVITGITLILQFLVLKFSRDAEKWYF